MSARVLLFIIALIQSTLYTLLFDYLDYDLSDDELELLDLGSYFREGREEEDAIKEDNEDE